MSKVIEATGFLKAGRLTIDQEFWPLSDGAVIVTVQRELATRSVNQNRWYWGFVVGLVAKHTGYSIHEIHEIYKAKFLPRVLSIPGEGGEIVAEFTIGGSTTQLNTVQFAEYCEQIREWAGAELGVVIPDPDPELR